MLKAGLGFSIALFFVTLLYGTRILATHESLLTLSKCRNGHTRLVTTNFDRLFEEVIAAKSLLIECLRAPLLYVPKNRWDSLAFGKDIIDCLHAGIAPGQTVAHQPVGGQCDLGACRLAERIGAEVRKDRAGG